MKNTAIDIYNPHVNQDVTSYYVETIRLALENADFSTEYISELNHNTDNSKKGIAVIQQSDVRKAVKAGYGKIIRWVQGSPEAESFMRHHSWIRYFILLYRNKQAMKKSDFILFCSEYMKEYYSKKFGMKFNNSYIMPCFNNELDENSFFKVPDKYKNNVFIYAGGLDKWQCFEETAALYSKIEKAVDNASFRVLVKDHELAKQILEKYGVKNYSLGFVPPEKIGEEMQKAKFGFCLRQDNLVNRVATPTKFSNYVSYGVMPIFTEYVYDFAKLTKNSKYCLCVPLNGTLSDYSKIIELCNLQIDPAQVLKDYKDLFKEYYSRDYHVKCMEKQFKKYIRF